MIGYIKMLLQPSCEVQVHVSPHACGTQKAVSFTTAHTLQAEAMDDKVLSAEDVWKKTETAEKMIDI